MPVSRAGRAAYYCVPMLFCVAVHWMALKTWFAADDFAWLGLRFEIHSPHDLWDTLFGVRAQGTIRTISERLYFLSFSSLFGMNALPMRIWTFLTQCANITLLIAVARRITGSALAGFIAPILWSATAAIVIPLQWSSAYNEICCAFFILLAFYLFLRYIETGRTEFWVAQWVVFLLGFGALELNVMYPALAFLYALCCARAFLKRAAFLFIPSIAFTLFHFFFVPKATDPVYAMHFDLGMLHTLWAHWGYAVAAMRADRIDWRPLWLGQAFAALVTVILVGFAVSKARQRDWRGVFLLCWFVLVLLPVLPLKEHSSEYYPTIPALGAAMLAAWALASSRFRAVYVFAAVYLTVSITEIHSAERYFYTRAREIKHLIQGLEAKRSEYAGKTILLNGVTKEVFDSVFWDDPFRLMGIQHVYLTPGSEKAITSNPAAEGFSRYVISFDLAYNALTKKEAVVYALTPQDLENVTPTYTALMSAENLAQHGEFVDVGNPVYTERLGPGWYPIENGSRWMGKSAGVRLSGPNTPAEQLSLKGFCPQAVLANGPLTLTVDVDGNKLGSAVLKKAGPFELHFALPATLAGKPAMSLTVEVNRTITPATDPRELGLLFGTFSVE